MPNSIVNSAYIVRVRRPTKEQYKKLIDINKTTLDSGDQRRPFLQRISDVHPAVLDVPDRSSITTVNKSNQPTMMDSIELEGIMNGKELRSFPLLKTVDDIPVDIFNIICDNIVQKMTELSNEYLASVRQRTKDTTAKYSPTAFTEFRDILYDILTYNLDITECVWYIIRHFVQIGKLRSENISGCLLQLFSFFKYYNNNYRPIYHLESIMFFIINHLE